MAGYTKRKAWRFIVEYRWKPATGNTMEFNILITKDSGLVGAIGELIAWQYLWQKGIHAYSFAAGRPWFMADKLVAEVQPDFYPNFEHRWLRKQQLEYLKNLKAHGPRRWDFVAIERMESVEWWLRNKKPKKVYLVEVKASRQGKSRHDLRGSMKGKIPEDIENVKRLGFQPLLLIIDFLENWTFKVREIAL